MNTPVRAFGNSGFGPLVLTRNVRSSTLVTRSTEARSAFTSEAGASARCSENTTSSAVSAAPLWNRTPGRSRNSQLCASKASVRHDAASSPTSSPFGPRVTSVS